MRRAIAGRRPQGKGYRLFHVITMLALPLIYAVYVGVAEAGRVTGGCSFYRSLGLERLFRDVQGARYHPLQETVQLRSAGRLALGLGIDG